MIQIIFFFIEIKGQTIEILSLSCNAEKTEKDIYFFWLGSVGTNETY